MRTSSTIETGHVWFNEARFGIFVHWGLYAIPARGEWVMEEERIPPAEYAKLSAQFNPAHFDADRWAALAKDAGAKYMVLTARHHDGYCLFDSRVSDFTSVKCAARRDFVREYADACRRHGLKVGLYYSLLDWRFPSCFTGPDANPADFKAMAAQCHAQVEELTTRYGRIDYLFYDGEWIPGYDWRRSPHGANKQEASPELVRLWRSDELNAMVRRHQPHILINNRSGTMEDIDSPEQHVTASRAGRLWESNMTIGDSWGYVKRNLDPKPVGQLIRHLVNAAAGGGNYLLNVGPAPDGTIQEEFTSRLLAMGRWLKGNGESIYGSDRTPLVLANTVPLRFAHSVLGTTTVRGNQAYLHLFRWPGETATFTGVANRVLKARFLDGGQAVRFEQTPDGKLLLKGLPDQAPDEYDTVIALELDGAPRIYNYDRKAL